MGLIATAIVALLGFATNDSEIIIPVVGMLVAAPLTCVACAEADKARAAMNLAERAAGQACRAVNP